MTNDLFTGGCLCGAVRYQCGKPLWTACFCHCSSCRRASGSHIVAWATVSRDEFWITSGTPRAYASSARVLRQFCERCGTPLTYWNAESADTIDVTIASLDAPDAIEPAEHVWMADAIAWDRPDDGKRQFHRERPLDKPLGKPSTGSST